MEVNKDTHTHHISQRFNTELEYLKNHLMTMGGFVEKQVKDAIQALLEADGALSEQVQANDNKINDMELAIDHECTQILVLRQPAASDLRLVIAVTKVVNDLERMGDEASKIARHAMQLVEEGESPRGYSEMRHIGNHVCRMVRDALNSFARFDAESAFMVAREDKSVDQEYKFAMRSLVTYMMEDPRSISRILNVMWALRALERIGDHARNIAEHVIYLVKGKDVRHISLDDIAKEIGL